MIIGVDVSHDKRVSACYGTSPGRLSCVGFTASFDAQYTQYHSWVAFQTKDWDRIESAQELMTSALEQYNHKNGFYPTNVIVYRDGVSNSQLRSFVEEETYEFQQAFTALGLRPKLTVVVVQKRVTTRLFRECPEFTRRGRCDVHNCRGQESHHSPAPGTVVDDTIVSAEFNDFFLVPSIAPPRATARPTRFIIVRDDLGLTPNDMQFMTNAYCMAYQNWQGPIRVPAPVMYAHKIAKLFGKQVNPIPSRPINGKFHGSLTDKLFYL